MNFCKHCGEEIYDDGELCDYCQETVDNLIKAILFGLGFGMLILLILLVLF